LSPNFNCYVSVYITLFCLLDVSNRRDSRHAWINVMKRPKKQKKNLCMPPCTDLWTTSSIWFLFLIQKTHTHTHNK
jgi:hypothetical protein